MSAGKKYPRDRISCAILAGGRGSRMQSRDKGLVNLAGRPMIEHVIQRIVPQVSTVIINANRHLEKYRSYGYPVISDRNRGFRGPLAGMAASLRHCNTHWMLTTPCDSPLLPDNLAAGLYHALQTQGADIAVATDGRRLHPVFCLLSAGLVDNLEAFLSAGGRKIDLWFERINTAKADFSAAAECFRNVNTTDELLELERSLST